MPFICLVLRPLVPYKRDSLVFYPWLRLPLHVDLFDSKFREGFLIDTGPSSGQAPQL